MEFEHPVGLGEEGRPFLAVVDAELGGRAGGREGGREGGEFEGRRSTKGEMHMVSRL
jgi:hypothetical protein